MTDQEKAKQAFRDLHEARGMISAARYTIAIEEARIKQRLIVVRDARIRLRQLSRDGDTEVACRGYVCAAIKSAGNLK